jgi:hypothetical protein
MALNITHSILFNNMWDWKGNQEKAGKLTV